MVCLLPSGPANPLGPESARAGLIAPSSVCPDSPAKVGGRQMAKARKSMICLVNYARHRRGRRGYHASPKLNWSAKRKSRDILHCRFSHEACGRQFDFWIRRSGYVRHRSWAAGENIAWGGGSLGNVRSIFVAWMRSSGHRQAILSRIYRDVGVGVVKGRFKRYRGARVWVLHFGRN